jgi:phosphoadenosine phosphosulfate reductase
MIGELKEKLTGLDSAEIVQYVARHYGDRSVFSTSFGIEDQVITHLLASAGASTTIFTLETGAL